MHNVARHLIVLLLLPMSVFAQDYPDYTDLYVNDFADLLDVKDESRLRETLSRLRGRTGIEFTIVTINAMADYGHQGEIEPFATGLFADWGVGDPDVNDGIMLLVAKDDRQMRIELGAGYPRSKDASMQRIVDDVILPEFRDALFTDGILMGTDAVIADVTLAPMSLSERVVSQLSNFWEWITGSVQYLYVLLAALLAGFSAWLYKRWKR